jgi:Family of unknown function (DUF5716)
MSAFSNELFREVRPEFLRILGGASAPLYVDVLDLLEQETGQRNEGISREEALAIVAEVLEVHPRLIVEDLEDIGVTNQVPVLTTREKSRLVLDRLIGAGWLEEQTQADYQRLIYFDPNGSILLAALRRIAYPDATVFSDKLVSVCAAICNATALAEQPWAQIETCADNLQQGLAELRAMQKSVERLTRRQIETQTLADNLRVVYDEYAEQVAKTCYVELVRAQLPTRLGEGQQRLSDLLKDSDLLYRMQTEVLRRDASIAAETAMARVRNKLDDLSRALERVLPLADMIDQRTAEFTRRSLARFRYLQEVVGERRAQVKHLFEGINRQFSGWRLADLDNTLELPPLTVPETRLLVGRDSLYQPRGRRTVEENEPIQDTVTEAMRERCKKEMEAALRTSLTVGRANRFVQRLPGGKGARISTEDFAVYSSEDVADVIAVLLHAESSEARFRVEVPRVLDDAPEAMLDRKDLYRLERFFIIKR